MKTIVLFLLLTLASTACVDRLPPLSPRRTNTEAHRQATDNPSCRECHDVTGLRHHRPTDTCLECHKLSFGGIQ